MARLAVQAGEKFLAEERIGIGQQKLGAAQPGPDPATQDVDAPGEGIPVAMAQGPVADQVTRRLARRQAGRGGTKVAQPAKAMQRDGKIATGRRHVPRGPVGGLHALTSQFETALEKGVGSLGLAENRVARGGDRGARPALVKPQAIEPGGIESLRQSLRLA